MLLLKSHSQPTLTLLIPPSKQLAPCGNPIYSIYWLAKEYKHITQTRFITYLRAWYLSNYHDALQAHKLESANTAANYHEYQQTLIKNGTANGVASNAYLTASVLCFC